MAGDLRDVLKSENNWPEGLVSKDAVARLSNCRELRCRGTPWTSKRQGSILLNFLPVANSILSLKARSDYSDSAVTSN